jgi:hypothetical protein
MGKAIHTPKIPKKFGRMSTNGIKKKPCKVEIMLLVLRRGRANYWIAIMGEAAKTQRKASGFGNPLDLWLKRQWVLQTAV